jgi:hypothetical protein
MKVDTPKELLVVGNRTPSIAQLKAVARRGIARAGAAGLKMNRLRVGRRRKRATRAVN